MIVKMTADTLTFGKTVFKEWIAPPFSPPARQSQMKRLLSEGFAL